jgi:hypothetical protein
LKRGSLSLGNHADRREVKAEVLSNLLQPVVIQTNRIVDPGVSIRLVSHSLEDLLERRSCSISLSAKDVLIQRRIEQTWPHPLYESLASEEAPCSQLFPDIHASSLANESSVCTYCTIPS